MAPIGEFEGNAPPPLVSPLQSVSKLVTADGAVAGRHTNIEREKNGAPHLSLSLFLSLSLVSLSLSFSRSSLSLSLSPDVYSLDHCVRLIVWVCASQ